MNEREKTNRQNLTDQLNKDLLNMLGGTARPASRTQAEESADGESDIFDDIFGDFKEAPEVSKNTAKSSADPICEPEPIPAPEPMQEPELIPEPIPVSVPAPEPAQKTMSTAEQETVATLPPEPEKPKRAETPVRKSANPAKSSPHMRYISYEDLEREQKQQQAQQTRPQSGQVQRQSSSAVSDRPPHAANPNRSRNQDTRKSGQNTDSMVRQRNNTKQKTSRKKKGSLIAVLTVFGILVLLLAIAAGAYFYLNQKGKVQLKKNQSIASITAPEEASSDDDGKTIVYNGTKYKYNEDNINILFMGVDRDMQDTGEKVIGENGQADVLIWAALDSKTGQLSLINISRDAMVDVNKYNVEDKYLGTEKMQICLAYSYGDGKEKSCENTLQSVSRLMYGMPVNAYVAIDYSAIAPLNDAIGGVTVNVLEDLTQSDSALKAGETVTLHGKQAQTYVRSRNTEVLDSNNQRMERQKQYIDAFLQQAINQTKKNLTLPVTLYNDVSDYMVTNISASEVTHLATLMIQNGVSGGDILTVPGEVTQGDVYAEFTPDDKELYKLILSVFYKEIKQ